MRTTTTTPAVIAVAAGLAIGATLLTAYRAQRRAQPTTDQLTDAHRAGYTLGLTHAARGLLRAAPEEP
ncbi:hypothetical protein OG909_12050 [Streptomyces sp. NBC_01754]|uniref:hypothetical protein n=1 Tax=Streptomyces sp. NBC_01754 TaxID=2975930 RepID=UPI002DD92AC1|nr:hypothetical protein [Streptomyces sp. NBC_01754]WSC92966.1 hypothetical protein OG909_12050 [Streptomyces sp. NBC_01754]